MDSLSGTGVFDLFNLDNGDDIDFETAYKMISNFDDEMVLPKMNFVEFTEIGLSGTLPSMSHLAPGVEEPQEQNQQENEHREDGGQHEDIKSWIHNDKIHEPGFDKNQVSSSRTMVDIRSSSARPELLSTYESNAIEHFLDNLISQDEGSTTTAPCRTCESDLQVPHIGVDKSLEELVPPMAKTSTRERKESFDVYVAPVVQIPDITISDSEAPAHLAHDPRPLRKWKHVEVERSRRNCIKKTFEELISLTKYPRGENNKIVKSSSDKRVPKHTLLAFIVEDMKSILQANEQLLLLLEESKGNTGRKGEHH
ncbi:hypothetical protein HG535_0G04260 [Zygotorulaspora mrakii]|uniref:BHLH domain-containing protein n=1 Tax=Zygotorulaspora mrakii TaxID=42260 RepID=A0A7H9B7R6_ZYGMR|nr:uncharacterized protein HG535_0G04260 [Zygotorulaspora mrakii]QLG74543.1 hypothetical protein HG535_0G04260 [Zygotorulaspora mrakii]